MLNDHSLVAGRGPKNGSGQPGRFSKRVHKIRDMHFRHFDVGNWFDTVIRDVQSHAPQPDKIARNLEVDNLLLAICQKLVGASPAKNKNVSHLICLPLMYQIASGDKGTPTLVQIIQHGQFKI